jgi:hypothetical protein
MLVRRYLHLCLFFFVGISAAIFVQRVEAQEAPPVSAARTLLLPRRIVSGERATLAVLDVNGRLTPGVTVNFSNGDKFKTDATGRAMFVAPLDPGVIFGSIPGRPGKVPTVILTPTEAAATAMEVEAAPRVAMLTDRVEIAGKGFCGDADANQVTMGGAPALVVASSPAALIAVPPAEIAAGQAEVRVSCGKQAAQPFSITFVTLELQADSSPLGPGTHRTLSVRVSGTSGKVMLEARNLAPDIATLSGGNPARQASSGGAENVGRFELVGKQKGSFLISIRLAPTLGRPK